jgi:hypothetical protein
MIKGFGATAVLVLLLTGATYAASPTAAQKAEFYEACAKRGEARLCECKADFAASTLDERMMGYVVAAMVSNASAPADINDRWSDYIVGSTQTCGSGV